jgi:hypothetical protein
VRKPCTVHETGATPDLDPDAARLFDLWGSWWATAGLEPLSVEQVVSCAACGYAGSLDALVRQADGQRLVIDFKTSGRVYPEYYLQLRAYQHALPGQVDGAAVVRIPKDGGPVEFDPVPESTTFADFKAALDLWRWARLTKGDDVGDLPDGGH